MQGLGEGTVAIRVVGAGSPTTLSLRPVPERGSPSDPLRGREVWHIVTDTTVLAGPRSPAGAVRLLDQLRCPALTRMRQRLVAAIHEVPGEPSATAAALRTLLQWPYRTRTALVHDVACAVDTAFQRGLLAGRPEVSRTLGWVLALTLAYPGDPLVLAPVLLRVRRLPAGCSFVLPAGWPFARLTGAAVGVGTGEQGRLHATLGQDHVDIAAFVSALERQPSRAGHSQILPDTAPAPSRSPTQTAQPGAPAQAVRPGAPTRPWRHGAALDSTAAGTGQHLDSALSRALEIAREMSALHPQLVHSPGVIDRQRPCPRRPSGAAIRA
jgi:hypothetical protein